MSKPTFVIAVDSARARLYRVEELETRGTPLLVEVSSLVHPEARIPQSQRFSDSNPNSFSAGSHRHTFDDHRDAHEDEDRRRFAKQIATTLNDVAQLPCETIVCSTHAMRSSLAEALERSCRRAHVTLHTAEYTQLSPHELSETLLGQGWLGNRAAE
jgi:hypothetical protein